MTASNPKTLFRELSAKQLAALAAIEQHTARRGHGPTLSQVAERLNLHSKSSARHYILQLTALGMVTYEQVGEMQQAAAHTLRLTDKGHNTLKRVERVRRVPFLRGKLGLVLDGRELRAAEEAGLLLKQHDVHFEGERVVITFRNNRERDFWAGEILEQLVL